MTNELTTLLRNIDEVKPYEKNPRLNDKAVDAVAASLREFGFRQPIVVDPEGVVIAGHTRLKAAKQLGLTKVPVHVAKDLTAEQIKAYRIADNKSGDIASFVFRNNRFRRMSEVDVFRHVFDGISPLFCLDNYRRLPDRLFRSSLFRHTIVRYI